MGINKNEFCYLHHNEIRALDIPDIVKGLLLSPFHINKRNGHIQVPTEVFREMIDLITMYVQDHDQEVTLKQGTGNEQTIPLNLI
ncbi:hypothetical protein PMPD1_4377 (plasmid) [Paramixta manurensis]|uniref:Uncharacterized protein n=1 Tax=Paramixta manurensis TaxID=2740817 RepID=A0A6M8UFC0_9GAMM|nr:hypothetical protein PMPD1_4377 [Erwiniaceae bacterium PD-1]